MMNYLKLFETVHMNHKYSSALDKWMIEALKAPVFVVNKTDSDYVVELNGRIFWVGNSCYGFHCVGSTILNVRPSRLNIIKFFDVYDRQLSN